MRNLTYRGRFASGIWRFAVILLLLLHIALARDVLVAQAPASATPKSEATGSVYRYRPQTRVAPSLESTFKQLAPGSDEFPEEKEAEELAARLRELSGRLREH